MPISNSPAKVLLPASQPGKPPGARSFTVNEINRKVDQLLSTDRSNTRNFVIELLYNFVALTESSLFDAVRSQVDVRSIDSFARCLSSYRAEGLISNVSQGVLKQVLRAGFPKPESRQLRAYRLGPVGEKYVERKGWNGNAPILSASDEHLAHDLICAEAMIRMSQLWLNHPTNSGIVEVRGPREVLAWDSENNVGVVFPDGILLKRAKENSDESGEGASELVFLVEYQNVRALLQVRNKLKKYEEISKPKHRWVWEDVWGLDAMPYVLVIYRQESTLKHYQREIKARGKMSAKFATISLDDVWAGNLSIKLIR